MKEAAALVALDGINSRALRAEARKVLANARGRRGGVSVWDASGLFEELAFAGGETGLPSARALLLLYAADLAFRLRWEIRPALEEGRVVIAAPYVETAVAFGRAAGLPRRWLRDLFAFALPAAQWRHVDATPASGSSRRDGFVEFGLKWMHRAPSRREMMTSVRRQLRARQAKDRKRHV